MAFRADAGQGRGLNLAPANPLHLLHDAALCLGALVQICTHVLQARGGFSEKSGGGKRLFRPPDARQDQQHQRVISMPTFVDMMKCDGCGRSEEHTSELQSLMQIVCRLLLEKKKISCLI